MVPRAEKDSAENSVCAASLRGAGEVVGSKIFLSWHCLELCFCQMVSSWWRNLREGKALFGPKRFVWFLECGVKKSLLLEGEDEGNLFVLTPLV